MSLHLYQKQLWGEPILNNTWYDEKGITVYTCHTPLSVVPNRTTTISKSIRSGDANDQSPEAASAHRANFIYLVQIDWKAIKSSKMRFGNGRFSGREIEVKQYIQKGSWGLYGQPSTFTGEDGKDYKWRIARLHLETRRWRAKMAETATSATWENVDSRGRCHFKDQDRLHLLMPFFWRCQKCANG
ncbi:hypothetical protein GYMLUDRAFT_240926 [Collybiopsis luxurians FD-317 M1]|nr:hypothetical protein GYMLUDRAFT_240926 [Collybiopsis luxurians FD-317 M1]